MADVTKKVPTVSIILPTYNRAYCVGRTIEAVIAQSFTDWELIICDDCSTDATTAVVEGFTSRDSRISYQRNSMRMDLPANRNAGIAHATARLIYFVEDDVVLEPDTIGKLVCAYKQLKAEGVKVGAVGPRSIEPPKKGKMLALETRTSARARAKMMDNPSFIDRWTGLMYQNFQTTGSGLKRSVLLPSWSLFDRDALDFIGGYESEAYMRFHCSHEETDLFVRLQKAGYKLFFCPGAVTHHMRESSGGARTSPFKYYYNYLGAHFIFLVRNFKWAATYMIPACLAFLTYSVLRASPVLLTGKE